MKVYFLSAGYDSCYYVRCMVPMHGGGWWGDIPTLHSPKLTEQEVGKAIRDADVVVFQRPMKQEHLNMMTALKLAGKKVVFDNDDTYIPDSGVPNIMKHIEGMEEKVDKMLTTIDHNLKLFAKNADLVTVSTKFLAKEYFDVNPNVRVLPNCINPDDWDEPIKNDTDKIRIGVSGSVASSRDYEYAKPLLEMLSKRDDVQLVMFGLPPESSKFDQQREFYKEDYEWWRSLNTEWYGWVGIEDYKEKLNSLKLDINLIPRIDNYFNRCKSNLKYLEHSMYKIPTIAQGFSTGDSPYQADIIDGENGFIAITPEDWINKTLDLINNKQKRETIGQNAYDYVIKNYNIHTNIDLWEDAYTELCEK